MKPSWYQIRKLRKQLIQQISKMKKNTAQTKENVDINAMARPNLHNHALKEVVNTKKTGNVKKIQTANSKANDQNQIQKNLLKLNLNEQKPVIMKDGKVQQKKDEIMKKDKIQMTQKVQPKQNQKQKQKQRISHLKEIKDHQKVVKDVKSPKTRDLKAKNTTVNPVVNEKQKLKVKQKMKEVQEQLLGLGLQDGKKVLHHVQIDDLKEQHQNRIEFAPEQRMKQNWNEKQMNEAAEINKKSDQKLVVKGHGVTTNKKLTDEKNQENQKVAKGSEKKQDSKFEEKKIEVRKPKIQNQRKKQQLKKHQKVKQQENELVEKWQKKCEKQCDIKKADKQKVVEIKKCDRKYQLRTIQAKRNQALAQVNQPLKNSKIVENKSHIHPNNGKIQTKQDKMIKSALMTQDKDKMEKHKRTNAGLQAKEQVVGK